MPKLGIIAGGGELPARLAASCRSEGRDFYLLALEGQATPELLGELAHAWTPVGTPQATVERLRAAGVEELTFAGTVHLRAVASPELDRLFEWCEVGYGGAGMGDDRLMRAISGAFERKGGFRVVAPHAVLPDLVIAPGPLGRLGPSPEQDRDIALGLKTARAIGALDIGQAVVIHRELVLAVEAAEGTDAMVARAAALRPEPSGGVLVKVSKPQQDRRLDPPAIGLRTLHAAATARLAGIAVEAGGTLVVNSAELARAADAAGVFVIAVEVRG